MTYLHIPYMYIHQISQHAADRSMHLHFLLRKSFFLFPTLSKQIIQTSKRHWASVPNNGKELRRRRQTKRGVDLIWLVGQDKPDRWIVSSRCPLLSPKPPERLIRTAGGLNYAVQVIRSAGKETVCSRNAVLRFYSHPY